MKLSNSLVGIVYSIAEFGSLIAVTFLSTFLNKKDAFILMNVSMATIPLVIMASGMVENYVTISPSRSVRCETNKPPVRRVVMIPNYQLDILEEENQTKYKIFIRETTSYFVYNKEHSDKNQYVKGRTLIRQLTNDSRVIPYRRSTVKSLQEKITEINLFIELTEVDKKYQDIKDELVKEIAEIDIKLNQINEKIANLNKMAEVLINLKSEDVSSRKLARYDFSKLNLAESITVEQVTE